jgi:hypothetical protein
MLFYKGLLYGSIKPFPIKVDDICSKKKFVCKDREELLNVFLWKLVEANDKIRRKDKDKTVDVNEVLSVMGIVKGGEVETMQFIDEWTLNVIDYCDYIQNPPLNPPAPFFDAYKIIKRYDRDFNG